MIRKILLGLNLLAVSLLAMDCNSVSNLKKYNGHYYGITSQTMKFDEAKLFAEQNGGYLAIPNSSAENEYLKNIIGGGTSAWIGIKDFTMSTQYSYTAGERVTPNRYTDINGNSLTYTNWNSNEPDNFVHPYDVINGEQKVSPLGEHWALMSGNSGKWYDYGNHVSNSNNPLKMKALLEFDTVPTCYEAPSTFNDEFTGLKCNTQVYDNTTGNLETGTTLDCQSDIYNNNYCPSALAEAGQQWEYDESFSVAGVGTTTDYTSKEETTNINRINYKWIKIGKRDYTLWGSNSFIWNGIRVSNQKKNRRIQLFYKNQIWYAKDTTVTKIINNEKIIASDGGNFLSNWGYIELYRKGCPSTYTDNGIGCEYIETITQCPSGYTETTGEETLNGECKKTIEYTYYEYQCKNETNEQGYNYTVVDSGGDSGKTDPDPTSDNTSTLDDDLNSSTAPINNCKREKFVCQTNEDRPPVWIDNKWQCSPFPCYGSEDIEVVGNVEGVNDKNNDGWSDSGACNGQVYLFNGNDKRCRDWDMFFGLTGGGCCDKDKVFLGLFECKEGEKQLAKLNRNNLCHYVGTYCSKKLKLGFAKICIQKSKSQCCFGSKVARAIHEQGRPQLNISWGSGDSPNCRGFTPEEFQKLDFSKIDLTGEFDIPTLDATTLTNTINGAVTNLQNMLGGS